MRTLLLLILAITALRAESRELLSVPEALRGVWMVHGISNDKGKTVDPLRPPEQLARFSATTARLASGAEMEVSRIRIRTGEDGKVVVTLAFPNGVWLVTEPSPGRYLVVVCPLKDGKLSEANRIICTVDR